MLKNRRPVEMLREHRRQREEQHLRQGEQGVARSADAQAIRDGVALGAATEAPAALQHPVRFASAAAVWMSATFLLCYLALPLARVALGMSLQTSASVMVTALASAGGLLGVMALLGTVVAIARPRVAARVDPDRILAATSGSLLVWGLLHNILPGLVHFSEMGGLELGTFIGSNILESALFGVVLASVSATGRGAFSLGALFQFLLFGLSYITLFMMF